MQAIIMAAGKGTRLGVLTDGNPKSFVELHGKKLIEYNLESLNRIGIDEIIIVTGYRCGAFEELTRDMGNVSLVYNPFYEMVNVLGSFYMGMEKLKEDFIYLHADTLCEPFILGELAKFKSDITLPVEYKKCDGEAMKIHSENGRIVQISKKIPPDKADGEFIGIASLKKETLPSLKAAVKSLLQRGQFMEYFEAAIQVLIETTDYKIGTIRMDNVFWAEIDFTEDYERARNLMPAYMYEE